MEPCISGGSECQEKLVKNNSDNKAMDFSNFIPLSSGAISIAILPAASNNGDSRPQNLKVAVCLEQKLESDDMEDKRRAIQEQDLSDLAIEVVVSNKRCNKHRSRSTVDIKPIITKIRNWGPSMKLSEKDLAAKLFWLLAVTGFLRASEIHRLDDDRSFITQGIINLAIIAPKKKSKGRPIIRPCKIIRHPDLVLFPLYTYEVYKQRIAQNLCPTPHVNNSSLMVSRLLGYLNDYAKPLSMDIITRYINSLSELIFRPPNTPIPKTRAIGANLASISGVSAGKVVTQTFWSN
ncbi:hypothetical protein AYI68_g4110 [Smittium mucronatum]|uniref:Tyr recombinase domain-containing protein n=1 Tax=Smittium mucronatum TaxID=133383 RepID=A0A1R0GY00_9FUNG|nr:hypothetical protein AYI68_g4110 [Smittium mucronatum]